MTEQSLPEESIFLHALDLKPAADREAYLDQACGDNEKLRAEVEALLRAHLKSGDVLDLPESPDATLDQPITEKPGTVIGPYKLLQQIGEGGMGVVYMAEQSEPVERRVALKIIKPGMDTRQVIARFEAERQALAMMDHPNIARVLDAGTTDSGRPYFVMELVKGIPVTKYCDEQHLTPKERLDLFIPVCQAVQHAHQKGIIHRDIKPSNILVALYDGQPVPKVIDFGVAKATSQKLTEKTMFTQYGQIVGTLEYMSPEQANLNQLDIDTRSDIYSLGVLLYELLTGATPFDKERLRSAAFEEMMRIIREEEPPRPSLRLSTIDTLPSVAANRKIEPRKLSVLVRGELDWIVMKALEKDRARRYETATGFANDIQRYLNDEAVVACPPSAGYRFRKFARRNKTTFAITAVVLLCLIVGVFGTSWQAIRATTAERLARQRLVTEQRAREEADQARKAESEQRLLAEQERDRATAAEEKAKTEVAIAQAVNDFINKDLLSQANPFNEPDRDIKLRTVVDRAAEKISGRFDDQPLVEAAIRFTLTETYQALGEYQEAEQHTKRTLELRRQVLGEEDPSTLISIDKLAALYHAQGRSSDAMTLQLKCLETRRRVLGEEHPDTLSSMNNLAALYRNLGRYQEAETQFENVLAILSRVFGQDDRRTLVVMHNLASAYKSQGRYEEAEALFLKVLKIKSRALGEEDPNTLSSMNSLAGLYRVLGRYQEAKTLFEKTLEIRCRVLGEEHADTLRSIGCLAALCYNEGHFQEAEALFAKTLETRRRVLGEEHPHTLESMDNLALTYQAQCRYDEAERLHLMALETLRRVLGEEHPGTLTSTNNLAMVYDAQARYDEAAPLYEKAFEIQRRLSGDEHANTLTFMNNLATLYLRQKRYQESETLHEKALEIRSRVFGKEHPHTLLSMMGLAELYSVQARYDEAEDLHSKALEIQRRELGEEHPNTLAAMNNLAMVYYAQGRYDEAEPLHLKTLETRRRVLGDEHRNTSTSMNNLALVYQAQLRYDEAEPLHEKALEISSRILGEEHPVTLKLENNLARLFLRQNKYSKAEPPLREALAIREKKLPDDWRRFDAMSLLGASLLGQAQALRATNVETAEETFAEAEPLLVQGYEGMKQRETRIPAYRKDRLTTGLERVVELYEAWGKPEQAFQWRKKVE